MKTFEGTYPIMEMFYSVQGEGHFAGTPAFFIRLAGCDVGCVWCDVKESWDASLHPELGLDAIVKAVSDSGAHVVVVTGGEPSMYDLLPLTSALKMLEVRLHIETSGTNDLTGDWDWVTFSPKKFKEPQESVFQQASELKIIVFHPSDIPWGEDYASKMPASTLLYYQAEWDKREKSNALIFDYIRKNPRWRISLQTHKYLGVE